MFDLGCSIGYRRTTASFCQCQQGIGDVLAVLHGHDHRIRQLGLGQQFQVGGKAALPGDGIALSEHGKSLRAAVCSHDHPHHGRCITRPFGEMV